MRPVFFHRLRALCIGFAVLGSIGSASAESQHGIAMYGTPALPPDFVSLPYANPDAPRGGRLVVGNTGGFDSLNPFIQKGTPPWQLRFWGYESLMGRSLDEPFTLYGLLAESVRTAHDRSWPRHHTCATALCSRAPRCACCSGGRCRPPCLSCAHTPDNTTLPARQPHTYHTSPTSPTRARQMRGSHGINCVPPDATRRPARQHRCGRCRPVRSPATCCG